jgi:hypothetical protein
LDADCQSGKCCVSGNPAVGVCSATSRCLDGAICEYANDCNGGCLMAGATGVCATPCTASTDCPTSHFCGEEVCGEAPCSRFCLRDCTSGGAVTCTNIAPILACDATMNAEGISVSLCR